jgi:hypothetical protein
MSGQPLSVLMQGAPIAPGTKPKRLANNTVRYIATDGSTRTRLHGTDIVVQKGDVYTLSSGGWRTVTTKDRLSNFSPAHVYASKGAWYVYTPGHTNGQPPVPFFDGMRVDGDGNTLDKPNLRQAKRDDTLRRKVNLFCKKVDTVETLPTPNGGDCWLCMMSKATNGKTDRGGYTIGTDRADDTDHLLSHVKEGYLHGSLLVNAMRARGYTDTCIGMDFQMNLRDTFKRALRTYLLRSFGLSA